MTEVRVIAVLGAGDMGHGVAELAAVNGFQVRLRDVRPEALDEAMRKIRWSLGRLVERRRLAPEAAEGALARLAPTLHLSAAVDGADLVIEAVPEDLDLKRRVLAEAEAAAQAGAVLATNTSAIRIGELGAPLHDPSRLVGMHFFNPVLLMDLVEIVPGPASSPHAVASVEAVARRLGKTTVTLRRDTPGFVTSRLVTTWVGAALLCHEHGLGAKEQIDAALRFRAGFPMGPFELADYTGLDVGHHASAYLASRLGEAHAPAAELAALVARGELGKKTGRGFHVWEGQRLATPLAPDQAEGFDPALVLAVVANEAAKLLDEGVADAAEIDLAMRQGCAFPQGPLEWADGAGLDVVLKTLCTLEEATGHALARPSEGLVARVEAGRLGRRAGGGFHERAAAAPGAPPAYETLRVDVDEAVRVGTITLHRPHRLHALNATLFRELEAALARMEEDPRVRVVLLTGSGEKAFCAGADLAEVADVDGPGMAELARRGHLVCLRIEKMGKPVVAAINGHALGGGLELALPCDFRVAARRAQLALPEVTLGLLPAMGGTQRLPKLVGLSRAKEIALMGERFDAERAMAWGLVHRVLDDETFPAEAKAFAAALARRAPLALRHAKQLLNAAPTTDLLAGMEAEAAAFGLLAATEDAREGVASMLAKRPPGFRGR